MSKSTQKFIESLVQIVFWVIKTFFSIIGWTLKLIYKFFVSLFSSDTFDWFSFLPRIRKKRINQKEKVNVNINLEKMDLDDWWDNYRKDQKHFSNKKYVDEKKLTKEFKSSCRGKIGKRGTPSIIEEFRGYEYYPDFDNDETEFWEGYLSEWRRKVCSNEEIISEFELWDFHRNYFSVDQSYRKITIDELLDSRGQMKFEMMKLMRDDFFKKWKNEYYNKENKNWEEIDVNRIYFQTRSLMLGRQDFPISNYVWFMDNRPFTYSYRLTRDYMKWKCTKRVTKLVFDNVTKWESGKLFKDDEPQSELLNNPLWVNWNLVGKDLSMMKTKLKKEDKGGLEWLRDEVGSYIKERKSFYDDFGRESEYYISEGLISKFKNLK